MYKNYNRVNNYKTKNNINSIIYKCFNYRKYENFRKNLKVNCFCNSTIIYIYQNQNIKSGYFLKEDHSKECYSLDNNIDNNDLDNNDLDNNIFYNDKSQIYNKEFFLNYVKML